MIFESYLRVQLAEQAILHFPEWLLATRGEHPSIWEIHDAASEYVEDRLTDTDPDGRAKLAIIQHKRASRG